MEYYSSITQFYVFLATDDYNLFTQQHTVTIYGGETWGYEYATAEALPTPEPSAFLLTGGGLIGLLLLLCGRRHRVLHCADGQCSTLPASGIYGWLNGYAFPDYTTGRKYPGSLFARGGGR
jgi:hypothetical protein